MMEFGLKTCSLIKLRSLDISNISMKKKENVKRCTLKAPFLSSSFLLFFLYASVISFCDITCHNSSSKHVELGAVAVKVVVFSV